jgi:hypothetical protein
VAPLRGPVLMVVLEQSAHGDERVAGAGDDRMASS